MNKPLPLIVLFILSLLLASVGQAITVIDSTGTHTFSQSPKRVVTLSWAITENLLELGVTPLAIADVSAYRQWVVQPELPETVIDLGTRLEPNFERILSLKPDIILVEDDQASLVPTLRMIAPVLSFSTYRKDHDNYQAAENTFLQLAALFQKESLAQQKLRGLEQLLEKKAALLKAHFSHFSHFSHFKSTNGSSLPKVAAIRFTNASLLWVYGDNSMPQYALKKLGMLPALPQKASKWGVTQKKVIELGKINDGIVLYFEPSGPIGELFTSPLWQAMPFVKKNHYEAVAPVWSNGGPMSIGYIAEAITTALLKIEP
ncbi:iron-siderophore ABC transporter substrate-binding protein [Candidatus Sororendozoicomonas aggregata]|uniref:iron-siderophore ABC transporter substrate-binding protein n=1 Tax=Candidatus Sororendozoicomonas aggregata TaxID=3073239 RepID=UPI002ED485C7